MPSFIYRDFNLNFGINSNTGDLDTLYNEYAVKQAMKNLLLIRLGQKPFHPEFGSGIQSTLFNNFDPADANFLKHKIRSILKHYEPRIIIDSILVYDKSERNAIEISIQFRMRDHENLTDNLHLVLGSNSQ